MKSEISENIGLCKIGPISVINLWLQPQDLIELNFLGMDTHLIYNNISNHDSDIIMMIIIINYSIHLFITVQNSIHRTENLWQQRNRDSSKGLSNPKASWMFCKCSQILKWFFFNAKGQNDSIKELKTKKEKMSEEIGHTSQRWNALGKKVQLTQIALSRSLWESRFWVWIFSLIRKWFLVVFLRK